MTIPANDEVSEYAEYSVCPRCEKLNFLSTGRVGRGKLWWALRESKKKNFCVFCTSGEIISVYSESKGSNTAHAFSKT